MSYTLATVLVSLSLPAIALAIIVGIERRKKPHDDTTSVVATDPSPAELKMSATAATAAQNGLQDPRYRERAG